VLRAFDSAQQIAVALLPVTIPRAVKLAMQFGIYAYDAYYLQCCIENRLPLLSLDDRMCEVARRLQIQIVE
jgi:predicted nucleic acid-binding protein